MFSHWYKWVGQQNKLKSDLVYIIFCVISDMPVRFVCLLLPSSSNMKNLICIISSPGFIKCSADRINFIVLIIWELHQTDLQNICWHVIQETREKKKGKKWLLKVNQEEAKDFLSKDKRGEKDSRNKKRLSWKRKWSDEKKIWRAVEEKYKIQKGWFWRKGGERGGFVKEREEILIS